MKSTVFTGSGVALITPFNKDLSVDYSALENLIEWQIANKTDAIIICGTTGESPTLTHKEKEKLFAFSAEKIDGRVPFIAGTGSNDTSSAVSLTKMAEDSGADAALVVTPYYNKTTQDGILRHYGDIAKAADIPIIVYNVPSRTGFNIKPSTYLKLSTIKNIVAVKEANPDISAFSDTMSLCKGFLDFYSGNDDLITPLCSLGSKGVISVLANVCPMLTHNLCRYCLEGNYEAASKLQLSLLRLNRTLFCEVNPLPVKYAMQLMGLCSATTRPPLYDLQDKSKQEIAEALAELNLIK